MDCKNIQELFTAFTDGELTSSSAAGLQEHLATCSACRDEMAGFKQTIELLHSLEDLPAPHDLLISIRSKLERQGFFPRLWQRWHNLDLSMSWQSATATIAIAFTIMAVVKTLPPTENGPSNAPQSIANLEHETTLPPYSSRFAPSKTFSGSMPASTGTGSFSDRLFLNKNHSPFHEDLRHSEAINRLARLYRPDITVALHGLNMKNQTSLYNFLVSDNGWYAKQYDDKLIVYLPPGHIRTFQDLLKKYRIALPAHAFHNIQTGHKKKLISIAVQFH